MVFRRLYSSIPARQLATRISSMSTSAAESSTSRPQPITRGRLKPCRGYSVGTRLLAAKLSRAPLPPREKIKIKKESPTTSFTSTGLETKGRKKSQATLARKMSDIYPHASEGDYGFRPIRLYPAQAAMHLAFNPSYMPLPVHVGIKPYMTIPETRDDVDWMDSELGPFVKPPSSAKPPSELTDTTLLTDTYTPQSPLSEHLHVLSTLSSPPTFHHLGTFFQPPSSTSTNTTLPSESALPWERITPSGWSWDRVLAQMHDRAPAPISLSPDTKPAIDAAVVNLTKLLHRLDTAGRGRQRKASQSQVVQLVGPDGEDEFVRMDSTRRKRRTKISKHKYKKRRKVSSCSGLGFVRDEDVG